jgi:GNAT superfamily N-acetyltransferase
MKILEYDDVDPLQVLAINQMALDFALTPELVRRIRQTDPRPFPCLALYAVEGGSVMGQVGIFRLPMVSTEGREDVGGVWAVCTHPEYAGRGVASRLLEEAHARMRQAGLRFSTLGTSRSGLAHRLYRQHGYVETSVWARAHAAWETAHQPTRLCAENPGQAGYDLVERIYADIAKDYLGFAWRHTPFARLRRVSLEDVWALRENTRLVGYALARAEQGVLNISNLALQVETNPVEAIAALAAVVRTNYVQVTLSRPVEVSSLRRAGYYVAQPTWNGFMVKPLVPEVSAQEAFRRFGIGTDRFLISWMDVT